MAQGTVAAVVQSVQHQRRQRKLVYHLRFIVAVAERADVILMGHFGFGNNDRSRRDLIAYGAEQLHQQMGAGQMDTVGAHLFPQIAHRVQADIVRALNQVMQQYADNSDQHLGIVEVESHLIGAEGGL